MELWMALSSPLGLAVTAGVILLAYLIYRFACAPYQILKQHGIKGPRPLPFFGNYREIKKLGLQKFFEELYKKYGPVSGYYLGQRSNILLVDLEIMKQITVNEFNSFVEREEFLNFFDDGNHNTPEGLDQAKGEAWRRARRILSPTFSASKMKAMVPLVKNSCDTLVEKLGEFAESEKSVDVSRCH